MKITVYRFELYTGSEEDGTLKKIRSETIALKAGHDVNGFAVSLMEKHKADEIDYSVVVSCNMVD